MNDKRVACFLAFSCVSVLSARNELQGQTPAWIVNGKSGVVASDSAEASQAGVTMLDAGGNAIDAATAVSFALGVTRPYSTGAGGGGFMILRKANGEVEVLDFRETAPAAATTDMYAKHRASNTHPSTDGHLAVAVPGLIAGRCDALNRQGTMTLAQTLQPAIKLAEDGFAIDPHYVSNTRDALKHYQRNPTLKESCAYVYHLHLNGGALHSTGHVLKQPALARFLRSLAAAGPDLFYRGEVAQAIEREMIRHGGLIRSSDLQSYGVKIRQPIVSRYRQYTIIGMPPPSSGGIALAQILNTLEPLDLKTVQQKDPIKAAGFLVEAMKHAFADRARWLGDSDFVAVPVQHLTSTSYARRLSKQVRSGQHLKTEHYGMTQLPEDHGTSHFCVVDRWGNVVVSTETINTAFGSLAAVAEWGIILNNQMGDFTTAPGKPNAFGLIQSPLNAVAPHKRPLSSMSPTIVLSGDKPHLLIGASGGPRIITSVLDVMLNLLDHGMPLEQAMLAPRIHHQWLPDEVFFDQPPPDALAAGLTAKGYRISGKRKTGVVQAIVRTANGWQAASDPRKGGQPAAQRPTGKND